MTLVGILGGGQLGRMLALAGYPLGLRFRFLDPAEAAPVGALAEQVVAAYDDPEALARLAQGADVITYEFENVPDAAANALTQNHLVYPGVRALSVAQDRLYEKTLFQQQGIPTPPFRPVDSYADLDAALGEIGLPAVLKTRRLGYDGKGQRVLNTPDDVAPAWEALGPVPLILEGWVPFDRELSIVAMRSRTGETAFYPLPENGHRDGILARSLAPAPMLAATLQAQAEDYATRVLDDLGYIGVLAIELFQMGDTLLANEMAPRVHNSGHWTIEGAETSQFENHLRAILGWPLGSTATVGYSAMVNLIGTTPDPATLLEIEGAHLHLYAKAPRPGRKLGHVTLRADDFQVLQQRLFALEDVLAQA
jgi:5-(carboxyamino)imidazole ribonucleotide synthase